MKYKVKEIFLTLQGEGKQAGQVAVFCRFSGCNLWSGKEEQRESAICKFCDTDFFGTDGTLGGEYSCVDLVAAICGLWRGSQAENRLVVCTGGEPLLQLDQELIEALHAEKFRVAVETNGTLSAPEGIDWICVSPKQGAKLKQSKGNELKLVFPQPGFDPQNFLSMDFDHFLLQPMDGPQQRENTQAAIEYCLNHPRWQLSVQTHKVVGIR